MKVVICEKNIAAKRIAYFLSSGETKSLRMGSIPVYQFTRENETWNVIGLKGHIINLDYPPGYNQWNKIAPHELIDVEPCKNVSEKGIAIALKTLVQSNPFLIVATDFDREGELIGVESLDLIHTYAQTKKLTIKRAKFSAITGSEISKAFTQLTEVDYNLAQAGEARQVIDLVWGAVLTRFISLTSRRLGKDFLSIGRVQSPTLALLVKREKEIVSFQPKAYWKLIAQLKKGKNFDATHKDGQIWEQEHAETLYNKVKDGKTALITSVKTTTNKEYPPPPFNTTMFLQAASALGFSTSKAMSIAEELYMSGLVSYPRTDNTVYPKSLYLKGILEKLKNSVFAEHVQEILSNGRGYPTRGKKETTDHPPIHPVDVPKGKQLTPDQQKLYELIVRRFLATLAKDAISETCNASFDIKGEEFLASGYRILEPNWKSIYTYYRENKKPLPELIEKETIPITSIDLNKEETKPPTRYTQGALIAKMEQLQLGTKSTRHEIINKLYNRKYIIGKQLKPSSIAIAVIDALEGCEVVEPKMTAVLEEDMDLIADGKKTLTETVKESRDMLTDVMKKLEQDKEKIKTRITDAHIKQNKMGTCPNCGKELMIRTSRRGDRFIGCTGFPDCRTMFPLPQNGILSSSEKNCPTCGAPIIKIRGKKPIEICVNPRCSTNNGGENKQQSITVGTCPQCKKQMIVRFSRGGNRFVGCTGFPRCKQTYSLPQEGDLQSVKEPCTVCTAPMLQIKDSKGNIKKLCLNPECASRKK